MGQLVFQANSGGQTNLVGQNTASTFNLNIPLANGTLVSTGDTATVTSAMISGPVTTAKGGTGLTSFTSGGAVYATSTSALTTGTLPTSAGGTNLTSFTANGVVYASSTSALTTGSALVFDGTNLGLGGTPSAWGTGSGGYKAINIGTYGAAYDYETSGAVGLASNCYATASNWIYTQTYGASRFESILGQHRWYTAPSGTAGNAITFTQAMTLDASGRLLVGLTSTSAYTDGQISSTGASARPASTLKTIDTPSQSTQFIWNATDSGTRYFQSFLLGSSPTIVGSITSTGSVTLYNASSDYRLKNNQAPLTGSGTFIDALQPKTWDWAHDGSKGVGFIAHEFAEVSPSSVTGEKDAVDAEGKPLYQSMQASSAEVIANLVAEIQSLRKRLAALEAK